MTKSQRLCFNFEEIFNDHRKLCYLFIDVANYNTVKDFILRIQKGFNIKEPIYFCDKNGVYFPEFDDIRTLLECSDDVW